MRAAVGARPGRPAAMENLFARIPAASCTAVAVAFLMIGCAAMPSAPPPETPSVDATDLRVEFPATVTQGALVTGRVPAGSTASRGSRVLRSAPDGTVAFGVARDERGPVEVEVTFADGRRTRVAIPVAAREWPVERIVGVPASTVRPPAEIQARIAQEQARVNAARERDDDRVDFAQAFAWPVLGRVSGRFGNQRVYVLPDGTEDAGAPHSGMDIASPEGTPVLAPAAGVVTFADPGLYLTGGTLLLDHGHGVSSNFLHLSRIDVRVGDRVMQGQPIGAVGATGRATGPHLHWGMSWFDVRVDPLLVLERGTTSQP